MQTQKLSTLSSRNFRMQTTECKLLLIKQLWQDFLLPWLFWLYQPLTHMLYHLFIIKYVLVSFIPSHGNSRNGSVNYKQTMNEDSKNEVQTSSCSVTFSYNHACFSLCFFSASFIISLYDMLSSLVFLARNLSRLVSDWDFSTHLT